MERLLISLLRQRRDDRTLVCTPNGCNVRMLAAYGLAEFGAESSLASKAGRREVTFRARVTRQSVLSIS
jgi:hypothetical protein